MLTIKDIERINKLYWNEGYHQWMIAIEYDCSQGHISRILNEINLSYQVSLYGKYSRFYKNVIPNINEPRQAITLRTKREQLCCTKLNQRKVNSIRKSYYFGNVSQIELSRRYNVSQSTISRILSAYTWKNI